MVLLEVCAFSLMLASVVKLLDYLFQWDIMVE